jgi:hypothetical protein
MNGQSVQAKSLLHPRIASGFFSWHGVEPSWNIASLAACSQAGTLLQAM